MINYDTSVFNYNDSALWISDQIEEYEDVWLVCWWTDDNIHLDYDMNDNPGQVFRNWVFI